MEENLDLAADALDETRCAIANEDAEEALRCITAAATAMASVVSAIIAESKCIDEEDLDSECDAIPAELWCLLNEADEEEVGELE